MNFDALLKNHGKLFWWLHIGGWTFWGVFVKYLYTTEVLNEDIPGYYIYVAIISVIGALITLVLRYVYRFALARPFWVQMLAFFGGTSGAAWLWMRSRSHIFMTYVEDEQSFSDWVEQLGDAAEIYESVAYFSTFTSAWTVIAAWSVLYFGMKYHRIFQEVTESALKSSAMAHEAQLKMLRYQLNPHFLFNTLNAISTLILERDTELANRMVTKLSRFLRFSLDNDPLQKITLKDELEAAVEFVGVVIAWSHNPVFRKRYQVGEEVFRHGSQHVVPDFPCNLFVR